MIEAAALISLVRQDWPDFAVVTGLLLYNAAVGFWQDNKAASALAALKKGLALKARRPLDWTAHPNHGRSPPKWQVDHVIGTRFRIEPFRKLASATS